MDEDPYLIEKAQNLRRLNAPEFDEVKRIMAVRPSLTYRLFSSLKSWLGWR